LDVAVSSQVPQPTAPSIIPANMDEDRAPMYESGTGNPRQRLETADIELQRTVVVPLYPWKNDGNGLNPHLSQHSVLYVIGNGREHKHYQPSNLFVRLEHLNVSQR
jgi:hypothetical protein